MSRTGWFGYFAVNFFHHLRLSVSICGKNPPPLFVLAARFFLARAAGPVSAQPRRAIKDAEKDRDDQADRHEQDRDDVGLKGVQVFVHNARRWLTQGRRKAVTDAWLRCIRPSFRLPVQFKVK
jgi:hypothetical protein